MRDAAEYKSAKPEMPECPIASKLAGVAGFTDFRALLKYEICLCKITRLKMIFKFLPTHSIINRRVPGLLLFTGFNKSH
jgi:hypothetical protein